MRPRSIVQFDRFFLSSIALGLVNSILNYSANLDMLRSDPALAQQGLGSGFIITVLVFAIGIPLLLWYLIARRASNVAKWILVAMTALGLVMMVPSLALIFARGLVSGLVTSALTVLQLVAIWFLFKADARRWLESKGKDGPIDADVFN